MLSSTAAGAFAAAGFASVFGAGLASAFAAGLVSAAGVTGGFSASGFSAEAAGADSAPGAFECLPLPCRRSSNSSNSESLIRSSPPAALADAATGSASVFSGSAVPDVCAPACLPLP